jgi:DNA-binding transcriptional MocR family regulator
MSEKSDAIAAALRKAILRGDYADGERLSQPKLALKYGAHRSVVSDALYLLEFEGFASQDAEHAYHANASYQTRQIQRVLTQLDHIEWQCGRSLLKLAGGGERAMSPGRAAMLRKKSARLGPKARRGEAS